jgi:transposase
MGIWVGIDIAKHVHWACAIDDLGQVLVNQRVPNDPVGLQELIDTLAGLGGEPVIGLDVVGGIAALAQAMLWAAGFRLVHVSGLAVNRARQGMTGGEHKSDPRDARVIADQVRTRHDLRPIEPVSELELELRLLVGRRGDLQVEQTRRLARLHDLLASIHPGLERVLDLTTKGGLWPISRDVTPAEVRAAGRQGLIVHLQAAGGAAGPPDPDPGRSGLGRRPGPAARGRWGAAGRQPGPRAGRRGPGRPPAPERPGRRAGPPARAPP